MRTRTPLANRAGMWRRLALCTLVLVLQACGANDVDGGAPDAAPADAGSVETASATDAGAPDAGPPPPPDVSLADRLVATWTGIEEGERIGRLQATYVIAQTADGRFDVTQTGVSSPKFYVMAGAATPQRAFARVPDQIYSEGQTGPTSLELRGSGAFGAEVPGGPYDAVYDLETDTFTMEATITVRGGTSAFTFLFRDPVR